MPDFWQLDNAAAFTGLGKKARVFGRFVRLCVHFGIELLFIPPAEPKRNSAVERVNGLWVSSFWEKDHFASRRDLLRKKKKFLTWYEEDYAPPALQGLRVTEARNKVRRRKLSRREVTSLPEELPVTEGRVHFVRRVGADGFIEILKERWRVSKSLRGKYVWATIDLTKKRLSIYHRRSAKAKAKMIRQYDYKIAERVSQLQQGYRRRRKRVSVLHIIGRSGKHNPTAKRCTGEAIFECFGHDKINDQHRRRSRIKGAFQAYCLIPKPESQPTESTMS